MLFAPILAVEMPGNENLSRARPKGEAQCGR